MFKCLSKNSLLTYFVSKLMIIYISMLKYCCGKKVVRLKGNTRDILLNNKPVILICWHSRFVPLFTIAEIGIFTAVTSAHSDGNFLEEILKHYGHSVIRGSSRKNANSAMREIIKLGSKSMRLVVTPDGPTGPRFKLKGNLINIAKKFNVPIIPVTFSATHAVVLNTWDRFILPIPFLSKISVIFSDPIDANKLKSDSELEQIMLQMMVKADLSCKLKVDY